MRSSERNSGTVIGGAIAEAQAKLRDVCARAVAGETSRYDVPSACRELLMIVDFMVAPMATRRRITHLIPSGVDITARRKREQKLRPSLSASRS